MRTKLTLLLIFTLTTTLFAQKDNMIDGVVWVVGDEAILRSEVEQERLRAQYEGTRLNGDPYCVIPEQIAIQKLFIHQAKIDSISTNAGQIENQVNSQVNYYIREIGSKEKLEEYFKKSLSEIKEELRQVISDQQLVQQVQQNLVKDIQVTPADVRKFYAGLSADSIPTIPTQVEVQIITLDPKVTEDVKEATKARLREFADRVNSGQADFSMLARLYSDDTQSAKQGGELGFVGRGEVVPEFAAAAFALSEPGKISRVIETEYGYHIIQLIEKRGEKVNCRHILLRPRITSEDKIATISKLDSLAIDIRTGKLSFETAANLFSSDKDTKMNGGLLANAYNGSAKFELKDLPAQVAKAVNTMQIGAISEPFEMFSEKLGRNVFAIVKLKNRTESHKANINDDFQTLKMMCENEAKANSIQVWIGKKIAETYVFINEDWRDCTFQYSQWLDR